MRRICLPFYDRCPLGSGRHRDKMLIALFAHFFLQPNQSYLGYCRRGDELEEVKTVYEAILELDSVIPHSGFGATLNPVPLKKFDPPPKFYFRHAKFFLLNDLQPQVMALQQSCITLSGFFYFHSYAQFFFLLEYKYCIFFLMSQVLFTFLQKVPCTHRNMISIIHMCVSWKVQSIYYQTIHTFSLIDPNCLINKELRMSRLIYFKKNLDISFINTNCYTCLNFFAQIKNNLQFLNAYNKVKFYQNVHNEIFPDSQFSKFFIIPTFEFGQ